MPDTPYNSPAQWRHLLPRPDHHSHKYNRGYVLIQGGYPMTGAARLAAMSAARAGAGLTAIAVPEQAFNIYASHCLSIIVKPYLHTEALNHIIADNRINAYLIGPGAGVGEHTLTTTLNMLATQKPVVIDADAITSLNGQINLLRNHRPSSCVLTPHDGEFSRLFGQLTSDDMADRAQQASEAAILSGAVIVLKGFKTIIAAPDGRLLINNNAPPSLATAGAGDVLAGIITSLLAQGMPAFEASAASVWLHGAAASQFGLGLIADDLPDLLPGAFKLSA